jgi:DNA replication protein DnaC
MCQSDINSTFRKYLIDVGLQIKDPHIVDHVDGNTKGIHRYLIQGKVGTGKTEMARRICKYSGQRFIRLETSTMGNLQQSDIWQMICDQQLIVIDDLGAEPSAVIPKVEMALHSIIKAMAQYSDIGLILTTNLSVFGNDKNRLRDFYGDRIYDRLIGWLVVFETEGKSYRKQNLKVVA